MDFTCDLTVYAALVCFVAGAATHEAARRLLALYRSRRPRFGLPEEMLDGCAILDKYTADFEPLETGDGGYMLGLVARTGNVAVTPEDRAALHAAGWHQIPTLGHWAYDCTTDRTR